MWQEIIVGLCIVAATAFLLRRYLLQRGKRSTCGSCQTCNSGCHKGG